MGMSTDGVLDEAYQRMHRTGPEFSGWLSNHGPMAADALVRLGGADSVHPWLDVYTTRLEGPVPRARPLDPARWQEALGRETLLPAWLALLAREVEERPWTEVLGTWWPRLLPGVLAGATHGLIRTGHAVRALREVDNVVRRVELGQALAYWAARWQPVPGAAGRTGRLPVGEALDAVPWLEPGAHEGVRARVAALAVHPAWSSALSRADLGDEPSAVVARVTVEALRRYPAHAAGDPVMLVHAVTAPAAVAHVLPSLDPALRAASAVAAWSASAAVTAAYRLPVPVRVPTRREAEAQELAARAVAHGDEHVLKLAEAALGTGDLAAAGAAVGEAVDRVER